MNIETKKLNSRDIENFMDLIRVFENVFEMKNFKIPEEAHLRQLLERNSFIVFAAIQNKKIVGGLTAYTLSQYYSTKPMVYIYDLAVKNEFQRKGVGKMLISAIKNYAKEIGAEEVFVQADEQDVYALDFYRSTGGAEEKVVQFNYPLKKN